MHLPDRPVSRTARNNVDYWLREWSSRRESHRPPLLILIAELAQQLADRIDTLDDALREISERGDQ